MSVSDSPLPTGESAARETPGCGLALAWRRGDASETIPLTLLAQFFTVFVFPGGCFSLTPKLWSLHKGTVSMSSC